jgi:guanylate kinase
MNIIGTLYIISAPSGAGKTSLIKALLRQVDDLTVSVSHTTRAPRAGEIDGEDYHFIDVNRFQQLQAQNAFLEQAQVFGHFYGTARQSMQTLLNQGMDVILEIDWQGATQVRQQFLQAVSIFIFPPSYPELAQRLSARGQDSPAIIQRRMQDALNEMRHYTPFDYLVVNEVFDTALQQLKAIVHSQRLRMAQQKVRHQALFTDLGLG